MENNKLKNDPFIAAFVFDNANDHLLKATGLTDLEMAVSRLLPECMQNSVRIDGIHDMRIMVYEFPNAGSVPKPTEGNRDRYYHDLLIPAVNKLGLKLNVELHTQEVVFAMLHDLPIEWNKPGKVIRHRSEYAKHCKSFKGGFFDLVGKETRVVLPSGEEIGFGLRAMTLQGFGPVLV